uniref:RNA-directed DNA polymerase, eukaryota, reverse transcriptase zinc-binding domain protein n=1 Tax=Angiostrongylus cantonensis TaxID=6313 RepID=A0A0K0D674_ANGCA
MKWKNMKFIIRELPKKRILKSDVEGGRGDIWMKWKFSKTKTVDLQEILKSWNVLVLTNDIEDEEEAHQVSEDNPNDPDFDPTQRTSYRRRKVVHIRFI